MPNKSCTISTVYPQDLLDAQYKNWKWSVPGVVCADHKISILAPQRGITHSSSLQSIGKLIQGLKLISGVWGGWLAK